MILSMSEQARLFLMTVVIGFFLGFLYDVFRIIRKTFAHPDWLTQLEDILYWLSVTGLMFYFMLNKNYGEIRLFSIMGSFLGMGVYFMTISRIIMKVSLAVITFIKKVLSTMFVLISFPFRMLWRIISIPLGFIESATKKFTGKSKQLLKKTHTCVRIKQRKLFKDIKIIFRKI